MSVNDNPLIALAESIARDAHAGQRYGKHDYYEHHVCGVVSEVLNFFDEQDDDAVIVAILHDAIEDSDFTLKDLDDHGFPSHIIAAVDAITKRYFGETYDEYMDRVKQNDLAQIVKIADSMFNLRSSREEAKRLSENRPLNKSFDDYYMAVKRAEKYEKNLRFLTS